METELRRPSRRPVLFWPIGFAIAVWIAHAWHQDRLAAVLTFLPDLVLLLVMVIGNFLFFSPILRLFNLP